MKKERAAAGSEYWNEVGRTAVTRGHYLDAFLGELKRRAHLGLVRRWGGLPAHGRVLKTDLFEEAAGPDAWLDSLAGDEIQLIGMDISTTVVGQAQSQDVDRQCCYVAADARQLPFTDSSFALIVSPSTLDHFSSALDLGLSLRELARVLEPGGRLIITLDNRQNVTDPLLRLLNRVGWLPYYLGRSCTVTELTQELHAAGFVVQETTAILHNPRLMAVGALKLARALHWPPLITMVQRALVAAQRLEHTRWRYYTGSFVAAKAVRL